MELATIVIIKDRQAKTEREDKIQEDKSLEAIQNFRNPKSRPNFSSKFWNSISLTQNFNYLTSSVEIHHSIDDPVVNIGYSRDLRDAMES